MTKSRAARKINAEMAAEDSYRFLWCKHKKIPPKKGMCYWYTNIQSGKKPVEYKTNHQYNKRYEAHMKLLKEAFNEETSSFKLEITGDMGLGVFARYDLNIICDTSKRFTTKLQAKYYHVIKNVDWTNGIVTTHNNRGGRPAFAQRRSSSRIRDKKLGDFERSLVGPFNFLNHACDDHSQFEWEEEVIDETIHAFPRINREIKKGEQIFINYQNGMVGADVDYKCPFC